MGSLVPSKVHEVADAGLSDDRLVVFLEGVSRPSANRSYRREGQEATLDDLEHQDQVGLPAAEVGCCLEYLLDDRKKDRESGSKVAL
jgi:hypothetical protein